MIKLVTAIILGIYLALPIAASAENPHETVPMTHPKYWNDLPPTVHP